MKIVLQKIKYSFDKKKQNLCYVVAHSLLLLNLAKYFCANQMKKLRNTLIYRITYVFNHQ